MGNVQGGQGFDLKMRALRCTGAKPEAALPATDEASRLLLGSIGQDQPRPMEHAPVKSPTVPVKNSLLFRASCSFGSRAVEGRI